MAWFDRATKTKTIAESEETQPARNATHATWIHGDAACMENVSNPSTADRRREAAHRLASGKQYEIKIGLLVDAKRSWPGVETGCKCTSKSVIPV
jgi:hypothetical protein